MYKYKTELEYVQEIHDEMLLTYIAKNADYGMSAAKSLEEFGLVSAAVRISDKFNRFKQLIKPGYEQKVSDEKIEDTLIDLANYALITVAFMRNQAEEAKEAMTSINPGPPEIHPVDMKLSAKVLDMEDIVVYDSNQDVAERLR